MERLEITGHPMFARISPGWQYRHHLLQRMSHQGFWGDEDAEAFWTTETGHAEDEDRLFAPFNEGPVMQVPAEAHRYYINMDVWWWYRKWLRTRDDVLCVFYDLMDRLYHDPPREFAHVDQL